MHSNAAGCTERLPILLILRSGALRCGWMPEDKADFKSRASAGLGCTRIGNLRLLQSIAPIKSLVHLLPHGFVAIGLQVPHRGFNVGVSHPVLHSPKINAPPQMPCRKRGAELVQSEALWILARGPVSLASTSVYAARAADLTATLTRNSNLLPCVLPRRDWASDNA